MADITREEQYLSAIANGSTDVPEPVTREEQYLYQIAVNGGGGGAEDFVAEVSTNDFETFTSTVTVSDLQTAYSAGKNLKAKISTPMGDLWGCLSLATSTAFKFLIFVDSAGLVTCDSSGWALE